MNRKKGQSTLEYIIVMALIIAAIFAFANGGFRNKVTQSLNHAIEQINVVSNRVHY